MQLHKTKIYTSVMPNEAFAWSYIKVAVDAAVEHISYTISIPSTLTINVKVIENGDSNSFSQLKTYHSYILVYAFGHV